MACSEYNGFTGKWRDAVGRRQTRMWREHPELKPTRCDVCYQTEGAIHGHAEDYSTDEVYLPLCITCHLMLHMRFNATRLWEDYRLGVRHGFQGPPLQQSNGMWALKQTYPGLLYEDDYYVNDPRTATALDMLSPVKFTHPNTAKCDMAEKPAVKAPFDVAS